MNLLAEWYGQQPGTKQANKLKLEVVSASFAAVCTIGLSIWTIYDGALRLEAGEDKDMELGIPMTVFSVVGLAVNLFCLFLFHVQGIPTSCCGNEGQLNLCSAVLHMVGDTVRMIVILGSGLYLWISGSEDSGRIDAWCAIFVSLFTMVLMFPVVYGLVKTIHSLCSNSCQAKVSDEYSPPAGLTADDL